MGYLSRAGVRWLGGEILALAQEGTGDRLQGTGAAERAANLMGLPGLYRWSEVQATVRHAVSCVQLGDLYMDAGATSAAVHMYGRAVSDVWLDVTQPGLAVRAAAMLGLARLVKAEGATVLAVELARQGLKALNGPLRCDMVRDWWHGYGLRPDRMAAALSEICEQA
jgi:hypothetical protein